MRDTIRRGLVVAAYGRRGLLETEDGARMPFLVPGRRLRACCGDVVRWGPDPGDDSALLLGIEPRRNELARQPPRGTRAEVLAANLTHLLVVAAPEPEPDLFLVDRYLCAAALMDCEAAVIHNKCDLPGEPLADEYRPLGYPVIRTSSRSGEGLDSVRDWLGAGTGILVGQSGVGKSSLLNALSPEADTETRALSEASGEGRHTTTASVLHRLPGGGALVDTPGVRDFVPALPEPRRVMAGFMEIVRLADECRFADCLHRHEPGCAVREAVAAGEVAGRRYDSYRRLLNLALKAVERAYD